MHINYQAYNHKVAVLVYQFIWLGFHCFLSLIVLLLCFCPVIVTDSLVAKWDKIYFIWPVKFDFVY